MSNQFEEGARGAKVAKLVEQLDRLALADQKNIFDPEVALGMAKFVHGLDEEQKRGLCDAAKVQTRKMPSETTWQNVAAVFERRARESGGDEMDRTDENRYMYTEDDRTCDNGWREPAEDDDDYPF